MCVAVDVLGCAGTAESGGSHLDGPGWEMLAAGDINGDCRVDIVDLVLIAFHGIEKVPTRSIDIAAAKWQNSLTAGQGAITLRDRGQGWKETDNRYVGRYRLGQECRCG